MGMKGCTSAGLKLLAQGGEGLGVFGEEEGVVPSDLVLLLLGVLVAGLGVAGVQQETLAYELLDDLGLVEDQQRRHAPASLRPEGQERAVLDQRGPLLVIVERHVVKLGHVVVHQPRLLGCTERVRAPCGC